MIKLLLLLSSRQKVTTAAHCGVRWTWVCCLLLRFTRFRFRFGFFRGCRRRSWWCVTRWGRRMIGAAHWRGRCRFGCGGCSRSSCSVAFAFEALLTPQVAAVFEHVACHVVKCPIGAFSWPICASRHLAGYKRGYLKEFIRIYYYAIAHFNKAVVKWERMSNRILPSLLILSIVRKRLHDKLIDVV